MHFARTLVVLATLRVQLQTQLFLHPADTWAVLPSKLSSSLLKIQAHTLRTCAPLGEVQHDLHHLKNPMNFHKTVQDDLPAAQAGAMSSAASHSSLPSQDHFLAAPPDRAASLQNGSVPSIASEQTEVDDLVEIPLQVINPPSPHQGLCQAFPELHGVSIQLATMTRHGRSMS